MTQESALRKSPTGSAPAQFGHGIHAGGEGVQDQVPPVPLRPAQAMQQLPKVGARQLALGDGRGSRAKHLTRPPKYKIIEGKR
jgi:hypothetical protein